VIFNFVKEFLTWHMKKIITIALSLILFISCREVSSSTESTPATSTPGTLENALESTVDTTNFTQIEWLTPIDQQLGKLTPNKEVDIIWNFKNAGNKPLIIENVSASCGCTVPEKPEKPLAPGETGFIKAKFNGSGMGVIVKQVHVTANTTPAKDHTLSFGGEIIEKK
jgi:hypothetical protein